MFADRVRLPARAAAAACAVAAAVLGACMGSPEPQLAKGFDCVDDSPACLTERKAALNALMQDKSRAWVRHSPTPAAYASGVRMFAFKQHKRELSCEELGIGRREAEAAPRVLRGPGGSALTPAQVSRGVLLSAEVSRELDAEFRRRCKA